VICAALLLIFVLGRELITKPPVSHTEAGIWRAR
jgi:hypothetical protein